MCLCNRRTLLIGAAASLVTPALAESRWTEQTFIAAAFKMRLISEQAGGPPYGAVVVHDQGVVGRGPNRLPPDEHAERMAIRDAQKQLGTADLSGYVMYSTSRPCPACERAAAAAKIARMYYGPDGTDAGAPR
jgi:tRNA(Arg) A34 adenosine deaminase TadA